MIETCSVLNTTKFIGKKWTLLIFLELFKGENKWKRYNYLLKALNDITPKVLSQRLKEMQSNGLVEKRVENLASSYSLTPCGRDLINITKSYKNWVIKWKTNNKICSDKDCDKCEF